MIRLLFLSTLLLVFTESMAQDVNSIAGGFEGRFPVNDYPFFTRSINVDDNGVIFVPVTRRILKINLSGEYIEAAVGNGSSPYNEFVDGESALEVGVGFVRKVKFDNEGNLYFSTSDQIRKVDRNTGLVQTVAGIRTHGFSGDGGPAVEAEFNFIYDFDVEPVTGDIFIVDFRNRRVRKVDAESGIITTVAGSGKSGYTGDGGLAVSASFKDMGGVAVMDNELFISDRGNNCIRMVDLNTGKIKTIAGNGMSGYNGDNILAVNALLFAPEEIRITPEGDLLIADSRNHRIRKVERVTGLIQTIAGTGKKGRLSKTGTPALESALSRPVSISMDKSGNLYILDKMARSNNLFVRIHRINKDGIIDRIIESRDELFQPLGYKATDIDVYPASFDIDDGMNIYTAGLGTIARIDSKTSEYEIIAGTGDGLFLAPGLKAKEVRISPRSVAVNSDGDVYFTTYGVGTNIYKIDSQSGIIANVAGNGQQGFSGDGERAEFAEVYFPDHLIFDQNQNLYFSDTENHRIRKIDANTAIISTVAGNGIPAFSGDSGLAVNASIKDPGDIVFDSHGNMIFSDLGNRRIRKVDIATGIIETIAGFGSSESGGDGLLAIYAGMLPLSLAIDDADNIFLSDGSRIRKIDKETGIINTFAGKKTPGFSGDGGPAAEAEFGRRIYLQIRNDKLYVGDVENYRIRVLDLSSQSNIIPEDIELAGSFWTPKGTYRPTTWKEGRVQFSMDVKYKKNEARPRGTARVLFRKGPMYMIKKKVEVLQQLGELFIIEGTGTVNNDGDYNFSIRYARDKNKVRIIIHDAGKNELLYDSQYGDPDNAGPTMNFFPFDSWLTSEGTLQSEISEESLIDEVQDFAFYPNPVKSNLRLRIPVNPEYENVKITIINLLGEAVLDRTIPVGQESLLNLSNIEPGIYLLQIWDAQEVTTYRFVKN